MRMNGHAGIDDAILPREPSLDQAIVGEMTALDAAERAYAMAAARGDWTATNHAGRVMAGAAARLDPSRKRKRGPTKSGRHAKR